MSSVLAIRPTHPRATNDSRRISMTVLAHTSSRRRADEVQFFVVYVLTLPVFLVSSIAGRLLSGRRQAAPRGFGESLSIVQEAKASAQTCGSFSLMG